MFGKKFKTQLCKIGELVMAYNVTSINMTSHPRAFFVSYIRTNNSFTGHTVFKLSTKQLVTTSKCQLKSMAENIVRVVNDIEKEEGMLDRIQFCNIHYESTFSDLYADENWS